ncbi:MAG: alpha-amylase family glycosyl hydrolase [Defluviitaleaceae bacterium]|nr:alpha-amylase family glycosyl hydrolase [Defluviitaleaceae bacterium]
MRKLLQSRKLAIFMAFAMLFVSVVAPVGAFASPQFESGHIANETLPEPDNEPGEGNEGITGNGERDINVLNFANPYGLPTTPHGGSMLHVWNMTFTDIIAELPYIAAAGFNAIQTSPIGVHMLRGTGGGQGANGRWYDMYQPTAFRMGGGTDGPVHLRTNYLGTEDEFRAMTSAAAALGIHVIVDAVPNHTTSTQAQIDPVLWNHSPPIFHCQAYPGTGGPGWAFQLTEFGNRRHFIRARLLGLRDFYTASTYMQDLYMDFLGDIIDAGAAGFRFDAAHHIELPCDDIMFPGYGSDFWPNIASFVNERVDELGRIPFQYGEILGTGTRQNQYVQALRNYDYLVSSYEHSLVIRAAAQFGELAPGWDSPTYLLAGSPDGRTDLDALFGDGTRAVPWVECHDHYGNDGISRDIPNYRIAVGWALINSRADVTPLFFMRPGSGFVNSGNMFTRQADGSFLNNWGHNRFYREPVVAEVNWFSNYFHGQPERTSTHNNLAVIQRGPTGAYTGAVLVNVGFTPAIVGFPVQMADGLYTCQISDEIFTVDNGFLFGPTIPGSGVVVLMYGADAPPVPAPIVRAYPATSDHEDPVSYFWDPAGVVVTLGAINTTSHYFSVSLNGAPANFAPFTQGQQITIGAGSQAGDIFVLNLKGTNGLVTVTESYIFQRLAAEPQPYRMRIEYHRPSATGAWTNNVHIYTWGPEIFGGWPGAPMSETFPGSRIWYIYLPPGTAPGANVIFNAPGAGQTNNNIPLIGSMRVNQSGTGNNWDSPIPILPPPIPPLPDNVLLASAAAAAASMVPATVLGDIVLPATFANLGSIFGVTWESDNTAVIANDGTVTRPAHSTGDAVVNLTATLSINSQSVTVVIPVTVLQMGGAALIEDVEAAAAAADVTDLIGFAVGNSAAFVTGDVTLETSFTHNGIEFVITWGSDAANIINPVSGNVTRPAYGAGAVQPAGNTPVALTATFTHPDDAGLFVPVTFTLPVFQQRPSNMGVNPLNFDFGRHGLPDTPHGGNILHAWNMTFTEIERLLPQIAEAGFGVIQTSPIGESLHHWPDYVVYGNYHGRGRLEGGNCFTGAWQMLYQPTRFEIGNMLGSEAEFRSMTAAAAQHGIHVIVDAVPNHSTFSWIDIHPELRRPELFHAAPPSGGGGGLGHPDFFTPPEGVGRNWDRNLWSGREGQTRGRLVFLMDYWTGSPEFQGMYMEFLGRIVDAGATGFRYDAALHIEHSGDGQWASDFWGNIMPFVEDRVYDNHGVDVLQYGEILGGAAGKRGYLHYENMMLTPSGFGNHIRTNAITRGTNNLTTGASGWDSTTFHIAAGGGQAAGTATQMVPWIESHDEYGNAGVSRGLNDDQLRVGWALISARYGTTPLFLTRPGPNFENTGQLFVRNTDGSYTNVIGHREDLIFDPTVTAINWFSNYFINYPERTSTHGVAGAGGGGINIAMIERGPAGNGNKTGMVLANTGTMARAVDFPTWLAPGTYFCQVYGTEFTVSGGQITGPTDFVLPGRSVAVIRIGTPSPRFTAEPGTSEFDNAAGINVTVTAANTVAQNFSIYRNNTLVAGPTAFTADGFDVLVGQGAAPGDVFTLSLGGMDLDGQPIPRQTFYYTKLDPAGRIRVEFVMPAWNQARVWAWTGTQTGINDTWENINNLFEGTWNTAPQMRWDPEVVAWVFTFDPADAPFYVAFHNGAGAEDMPAGPGILRGYPITESTRIIGGELFPIGTDLSIEVMPAAPIDEWIEPRSFFMTDAGIEVTKIALNSTSRSFSLRVNGVYTINDQSFVSGDRLTMGVGANAGDVFVLTITASDGTDTISESFAYTRGAPAAPPARIRVEFIHDHTWTGAGLWTWGADGNIATGGWPGSNNRFTWCSIDNLWYFYLPPGRFIESGTIHNGDGSAQTPYIGAAGGHPQIRDHTRIYYIGGSVTQVPIVESVDMISFAPGDDEDSVTEDLALLGLYPVAGVNMVVTWVSSNAGIVNAATGEVTAPQTDTAVTLTATITHPNDFALTVVREYVVTVIGGGLGFVPVESITNVPTAGTVDIPLPLSGTVNPENATNNVIIWSVVSGLGTINADMLTAIAPGDVEVRATIANGTAVGVDFEQDFTIAFTNDVQQLPVPDNLSIAGTILSWDAVANASGYRVYVDGQDVDTVVIATLFDLAILELAAGTYSVQVRAIGDVTNFTDSELSASVNFVVVYVECREDLGAALTHVRGLNHSDFSRLSWALLHQVYMQAVVLYNNVHATAQELEDMTDRLWDAIDALVLTAPPPPPPPDKAPLIAAIEYAETFVVSDFTRLNWVLLQDALNHARSVVNNEHATQEQVGAALNRLNTAISNRIT